LTAETVGGGLAGGARSSTGDAEAVGEGVVGGALQAVCGIEARRTVGETRGAEGGGEVVSAVACLAGRGVAAGVAVRYAVKATYACEVVAGLTGCAGSWSGAEETGGLTGRAGRVGEVVAVETRAASVG
jgi:hypothetical protein